MKYYVENWETEEVIAEFDSYEQRRDWLEKNVNLTYVGGYLKDGTRIAIYEC